MLNPLFHILPQTCRRLSNIMLFDNLCNAFHMLGELDDVPGHYWWNVVPVVRYVERPLEIEAVV